MVTDASISPAVAKLNLVRSEIGKVIVGQQSVVDGVLICLVAGGHVLLEGVPGPRKNHPAAHPGAHAATAYSRIQFTPDLMPADIVGSMIMETDERGAQDAALSAGPDFRQPGAGRRDQSRHAEDAIGAARSHAGAHRHQRQDHARAGNAVSGDGDAEPHRNGRHLSAAGSAARPLPDEDRGHLSEPRTNWPASWNAPSRAKKRPCTRCSIAHDILDIRSVCHDILIAPHVQDYAVQLVMATQPDQTEAHDEAQQVYPLRQFAARRAGAGGMRPRAGADARPPAPQRGRY